MMFFMLMCTKGWWWSCSSAIGVDDDHVNDDHVDDDHVDDDHVDDDHVDDDHVDDDHVDDDHHRLVVEGVELFQCYWSSVSGLSPRSAEFPVDPQVHLLGEKYLGIVLD